VSFAAITPCVASQQVFIAVSVYFVIDSVRKLLNTSSYSRLGGIMSSMLVPFLAAYPFASLNSDYDDD
jgi:hypothetical protein